ncbi:MAG TPA: flagellar biosynthesis protein FlhB [Syntrophorhabdaceae bacterium]|jgi:flagellar biosynthetic protein FlhB
MADSFQEKTEQPTDKRLEESRKKGQVAQSKELPMCFMILFSSVFLYFSVSKGFEQMFKVYVTYVRNIDLDVNVGNVYGILAFGAYEWFVIVAPFFALLILVAVAGTVVQTRFMWSFEAIGFKIEKLNPLTGIKNLLSKKGAVELLKSLIKICLLTYIAYTLLMKELPELLSLPHKETRVIIEYLGRTCYSLSLKVGLFFLFLAGTDFLYQKWQHKKDLMMTFQEVKEEGKERDGNPQVKGRIRSLQREMARRRMMDDVKTADVIVTNPTTFAVALKYQPGAMPAPTIVGKGAGFVAEKIKEMARKNRIPIVENKPLARGLYYSVKVGDFVPENFYMIVAELLAQVYKQKRRSTL